ETTKEVQEDLKEYSASLNKVLSESVKKINEIFEDNYKDIGSYLKVFHRILKILNNRYESKDISHEEYKMYVGILRSQIEDYEFYIILINSLFTLRGTGMGIELIETSFFGDELDIDLKQHFEHPEFLTEIIKDNFVEKKSYRESVKTRKKIENYLKIER
ncbi:TPA: putative phage abortive infection protein, partial [Enterococcus faecium]